MKKKKENTDTVETQDVKEEAVETPEITEKESKPKKPIYKKWWFWVIIIIIIFAVIGSSGSDDEEDSESADAVQEETVDSSADAEDGISPADYDDALGFLEAYIDGIEENTSSMVDAIAEAAKKEANYSSTGLTDESLDYISSNYPEYFTDNQVMEYTMFYGYYLEYAYADNGSGNTYANLGMDTYQAVKYVYRGTASVDDDDVQANLEQIAEALNELGYSIETTPEIVSILEQFGTFDETTVTGSGDDVVDLPVTGVPVLMDITYSGSSNFVIYTIDAEGENVDLLVNTIGSYSGTQTDYLDYSDVTMLSVESSGDWSITFKPLSSLPELVNGAENTGDGVYYISTASLTKLTITNSGDGNFVVRGIGISDADLLVNEIGDYEGTVIWAEEESFLIVESEGTWTVSW